MSFLAELIPSDCWLILYLKHLRSFFNTVNEGGPELPCMTRVITINIITIIIAIIVIIIIIIITIIIITTLYASQIIIHHYLYYVQPNKKIFVEQYKNDKPHAK